MPILSTVGPGLPQGSYAKFLPWGQPLVTEYVCAYVGMREGVQSLNPYAPEGGLKGLSAYFPYCLPLCSACWVKIDSELAGRIQEALMGWMWLGPPPLFHHQLSFFMLIQV